MANRKLCLGLGKAEGAGRFAYRKLKDWYMPSNSAVTAYGYRHR